jgi:hypothetical protein
MNLDRSAATASWLPITEIELCRQVGKGRPGDSVIYHHGHLAVDAMSSSLTERERRELLRVAGRARSLEAAGMAHLMQRRIGTDAYVYLLIIRRQSLPRSAAPPASAPRMQVTLDNNHALPLQMRATEYPRPSQSTPPPPKLKRNAVKACSAARDQRDRRTRAMLPNVAPEVEQV